jgi:hypothetical protein
MVTPAVIAFALAAAALFGTAVERIGLEREAAAMLRQLAIGNEIPSSTDTELRTWNEGRLICLELTKSNLIPISTRHCALPLA